MTSQILAPDRVMLLLSLVAYLREQDGPVPVSELAKRFEVRPETLRELVRFLGTAGVPGETRTYQYEDLFDIDWDALIEDDLVQLTRTVAVDEAPRFSPAETAALIAGLQELTAVLPEDDAEIARGAAAKLGAALGAERAPIHTVTATPEDPKLPEIVAALEHGRALTFDYRDAAGEVTARAVDPWSLEERGDAWYLRAYCHDRRAERVFRVDRMSGLRVAGAEPTRTEAEPVGPRAASPRTEVAALVALVTARALPRLAGFAPEVLGSETDGRLRVRVEAWHRGTAILLASEAPGEVVVVEPASAREAVREWAERALAPYGD